MPTLGVTYTLQYEPVAAIAAALDALQATRRSTSRSTSTRRAAASSRRSSRPSSWDFRLPRVHSINSSGHKYGLAPLGCGWVIWRDTVDLPEELIFRVNYLGGNMPTFALNFSRSGGPIIAQYYNLVRLGREGYAKVHAAAYATAQYLADEIAKLGPFT